MSDIQFSINTVFDKLKSVSNNPVWEGACETFINTAHTVELDDLTLIFDPPQWVTDLENALTNGNSEIRKAIDDFALKVTNPVDDLKIKVNGVREEINRALDQATDLKTGVDRALGNIITKAQKFLDHLPDINDVNDQIMDSVIRQIVEAVKTGETNLNEKNLMIYAGEFKSGFEFNIPAVHIDADFNFKIGPGTP